MRLKSPLESGGNLQIHLPYRMRTALAALVALSLTGCMELLVEPAAESAAGLSVSLAVSPLDGTIAASAEAGAAFDAADRVRVELRRGGQVVVDVNQAFTADGSENRVRIEVDVDGEESLDLEVKLLLQGQTLFHAVRSVTLRRGETTEAQLSLVPVAGGVQLQSGAVVLEAIGAQAQLSGTVVFATGDAISELQPTWATNAPAIVQVNQFGQVTAMSPGEAQIMASFGGFSATVTVRVALVVASVVVVPGSSTLSVGGTLPLQAQLFDSGGHPISPAGRTVGWSSSNPNVAGVNSQGVVTGQSEGNAVITATSEGVSGTAGISVLAPGKVTGQVMSGVSSQPITGAVVEFSASGQEVVVTTGANGTFSVDLPVGTYTARISASGYNTRVLAGISVSSGATTNLGAIVLQAATVDTDLDGIWKYRDVNGFEFEDDLFLALSDGATQGIDIEAFDGCFFFIRFEQIGTEGDFRIYRTEFGDDVFGRLVLESPDVLLVDGDDGFQFRLDRTTLTMDQLQPECAPSEGQMEEGEPDPPGRVGLFPQPVKP